MNILNSLRDVVSSKYVSNADYVRKSYSRSVNSVIEDISQISLYAQKIQNKSLILLRLHIMREFQ